MKLTRKQRLVVVAQRRDDPKAFSAWYELLHVNKLPDHSKKEIEQIFEAHGHGMGSLTFAWRGSWKSSVISVAFQAFEIGKEPDKSFLTVGSNDDSAEDVTSAIARIIEFHDAWKAVFPNIVPDKDRGWGKMGHNVMDDTIDCSQTPDSYLR